MRVMAILVEKELDAVVDGTLVRTESNKDVYIRKNNQAKSVIILNISEDQLTHIKSTDSACHLAACRFIGQLSLYQKAKFLHKIKGIPKDS